jgi:alpha-2-macroglobulin-like protein
VFEESNVGADGRATLVPRAERLVFRRPTEQLRLNVIPDKARYSPSGRVTLDIAATNEKARPAPAILLVGVVNQSVIAMAANKTDRLLPTQFLLAGEVRHPAELEHADFLLTDHPKAAVALDLLLGTQGWRRFAEQNVVPVDQGQRQEVERMLVAQGQRTGAPVELLKLEEKRLASEYQPKLEQMTARVMTADAAQDRYRKEEEPAFATRVNLARAQAVSAHNIYEESAAELFRFETRAERIRGWALPLFLLGLIALAVGGIAMAVNRTGLDGRRYVFGTVGAAVLAALVLGGIIQTRGTFEAEQAFVSVENTRRLTYGGGPRPNPPVQNAIPVPDPDREERPIPVKDPVEKLPGPRGPKQINVSARDAANQERDAEVAKKAAGRPKDPGQPVQNDTSKQYDQRDALEEKLRARQQAANGDLPLGSLPFIVREYAHQRDPALGAARQDHAETMFWHPVLVLPENGRTRVEFQLSDDIARYQILVAGHTLDGRIGAITRTIEARKPVTVDPKLPAEISSNDVVEVPVRIVNDTDSRRSVDITLSPTNLAVDGAGVKTAGGLLKELLELGPNGKGRKVLRVRPTTPSGTAALAVIGTSDPATEPDSTVSEMRIVPDGFPFQGSFSDLLERRSAGTIDIPKDVVKGTLKARLELYPSTMADLLKGLDGLLREPTGCFEQSSTANYPNTLILDYLQETNASNPEAGKRAREFLDRGYGRLASFECPDSATKSKQGFEWFGTPDHPHEALTAYGLLQFKDMSRVSSVVDAELIKRTQAFLLSRRDGHGGFKTDPRAVDSFGRAPKHTTDAYIVWALVESDPDNREKLDLATEIEALRAEALNADFRGGKDAYFIALVANVLLQRGDRDSAEKLLVRLRDKHLNGGLISGAETSVTRSGGRDLQIETTALTVLGWLRANDAKYAGAVKAATHWLTQQRGGAGGFGSTQGTILALKALTLHARKNARPPEAGEVKLIVGGKQVAAKRFTEADVDVIALDVSNAEELFPPGEKTSVEIVTDARQSYPFTLSFSGASPTPVSAEQAPLRLSTSLGRLEAEEGQTIPLSVALENRQESGQGMAIAVVGIPAGLKVPTDLKQLTDLRENGIVSFFEVRGRELVLYWRELAPEQKINFTVDLVCDVPGEYRGPASRAYLYYTSDLKHWVEPLAVKIRPMQDQAAQK